jgi:osmotically-inducible protein OsmY
MSRFHPGSLECWRCNRVGRNGLRRVPEDIDKECAMTATMTRADEEIQRDVQDELKWDARVQPHEIGIIVKDGVVTLNGWVDSYVKRWAAERAALRVSGARAVANDIEIRLSGSGERTDQDIAAAATRALEWHTLVPDDSIDVTVAGGWVTLKGRAEWQFQKNAAERAVRKLTGVRRVSNLVMVMPRRKPSPPELTRQIREALVRNAETDAEQIGAEVIGDRVVLTGAVGSWAERDEAERVVWSAPGVREVENHIVVEA